jgi:hypothetical protein
MARLGLLTGGLALVGTGSLLVGSAGAQASPTLSITPETITVGQSATLLATGCVAEGVAQEDLFVVFSAGEGGNPIPTDETGSASFDTGPAPVEAIGSYTVTADCVLDDGVEDPEVLFTYEQSPVLTVVAAAPTTTSTSTTMAPTTTAPAAASPAVVTPAFTG